MLEDGRKCFGARGSPRPDDSPTALQALAPHHQPLVNLLHYSLMPSTVVIGTCHLSVPMWQTVESKALLHRHHETELTVSFFLLGSAWTCLPQFCLYRISKERKPPHVTLAHYGNNDELFLILLPKLASSSFSDHCQTLPPRAAPHLPCPGPSMSPRPASPALAKPRPTSHWLPGGPGLGSASLSSPTGPLPQLSSLLVGSCADILLSLCAPRSPMAPFPTLFPCLDHLDLPQAVSCLKPSPGAAVVLAELFSLSP